MLRREGQMNRVLRRVSVALLVLLAVGVVGIAAFAVDVFSRKPLVAVHSTTHPKLDRRQCVECHQPIAQEWRQSFHYRSIGGPYWKEVREMGYMKIFDPIRKPCVNCHAPADVLDLPRDAGNSSDRDGEGELGVECTPNLVRNAKGIMPEARSDDADMGVDCVACHVSRQGVTGRGSRPNEYHETLADARFQNPSATSAQFCITCHGSAVRAWQKSGYPGGGVTCLDCHMPLVHAPSVAGGPARMRRSHLFLADKDMGMLKKAVEASMEVTPERAAVVRIRNRGAGHFLPSGGNWLLVYFSVYDDSGKLIKQERQDFGRAEALLLDFWPFGSDDRIAPGTVRTASLSLPPSGHGRVEAVIRYHDWHKVNPAVVTMQKRF